MLTLLAPAPLSGLARDDALMALLTRMALRADDLLGMCPEGVVMVPAANVRADANRIKAACDEARQALVRSHAE
jgi:hypothetical protein